MLLHIKFIIIFILLSYLSPAQVIQKIDIRGNRNFSSDEITTFIGVGRNSEFYPGLDDTIKVRAARNFASMGYVNSTIDVSTILSADSLFMEMTIQIREGDPAIIRNLNFENADHIDSFYVLPEFGYLEGDVFNKFQIEENISNALFFYENNGFPFARLIISSVNFVFDSVEENTFADINIRIDKAAQNTIDKIEITGNTKTKSYVITRELRLTQGELYSQRRIEELPSRLNRLRYFEPVVVPSFYINSKNEGVLLITINEKVTNNFDGIVGYVPPVRENEKGYFTGLVNVGLRNLFGTGRAAAIRWQQTNRLTQELELRYLEPWLLGYPFNISGSLFQRKQDTIYVQRKYEGNVEFLATEDISASLFVSSEQVIPTFSEVQKFTVYNSSSLTSGVGIKFDSRDDPYAPTKGILFTTAYSFSKKKIFGPSQFIFPSTLTSINLQRITFDMSFFYELFRRHVAALGVHARELRASTVEESDLFRLGGTSSLRGYREQQFLGNRIFWSNIEYRFLLTRRSYAFAFFDSGYYLRNEDKEKNIIRMEEFKLGYGAGLSIETGIGILSVSFALAKGEAFRDGKIHFGVINEF